MLARIASTPEKCLYINQNICLVLGNKNSCVAVTVAATAIVIMVVAIAIAIAIVPPAAKYVVLVAI